MATTSSTDTATTTSPSKTFITEETRAAVLQQKDAAQHCLVCYSDLTAYHTLTPCHHDEICPTCHLRLRKLHADTACPICKQGHDQLIVVASAASSPTTTTSTATTQQQYFEDYNIWGNSLGSDFVYRDDVGMFFPIEYYHREIQPLFGYHCTVPTCEYTGISTAVPSEAAAATNTTQQPNRDDDDDNDALFPKSSSANNPLRALQDHLRTKHRLTLCNLCVEHKRDFVSKLPRFTPHKLKQHLQSGDGPGTGFEGHPLCEFCRPKRFYDITALHLHLQKEHYKCHVCEQHSGLLNQYFNNYKSLERHFDRQHFLCHDVQCLQARFVVFGSELDLRHHERSVHGGTSTGDSKIQLSFRYARRGNDDQQYHQQNVPTEDDFNYGLDGEAFVPAAMPSQQQRDAVTLHPLHVQRTAELREQAAAIRAEQERGVEAFPTLAEAVAAEANTDQQQDPNRLRIGWASGATLQRLTKKPAGMVTEEDYPSLPQGASKKKGSAGGAATAKLKAPPQRQFAAMTQQAGGGGWPKNAASLAAPPSTRSHDTSGSSFLTTSVATAPRIIQIQQQQNVLSADNFPALGPSAQRGQPTYAAAEAFAASRRKPNNNNQKGQAPFTDADFPAPPSSTSTTVRQRMLGSQPSTQSHAAMSNVLAAPSSFPSLSTNKAVTVQDMKATLGQAKYKQLKEYTKQFVASEMTPDAYVDHAAALFENGYGDVDFWSFMPSLISSCPAPGQSAKQQALEYMESLRKSRVGAMNHEQTTMRQTTSAASTAARTTSTATASSAPGIPVSGQWSSVQSSRVTTAPQAVISPPQRVVTPPLQYNATPSINVVRNKTKNAWGNSQSSGGANIVQMVQAPPGTVGAAAAKQAPRVGTATKFMASQQQVQQAKGNSGNNKKKSKQSKELQDLAFGKK